MLYMSYVPPVNLGWLHVRYIISTVAIMLINTDIFQLYFCPTSACACTSRLYRRNGLLYTRFAYYQDLGMWCIIWCIILCIQMMYHICMRDYVSQCDVSFKVFVMYHLMRLWCMAMLYIIRRYPVGGRYNNEGNGRQEHNVVFTWENDYVIGGWYGHRKRCD